MKSYEIMYITKPIETAIAEAEAKIINVINTNGNVEKICKWGKKRLAYRIGDYEEGYYTLVTFTADAPTIKELDRIAHIDENIMRHIIISKL